AVLGLELHQQRDRVVGRGEDQRSARGEGFERPEDRRVADRVRDRLHVQLGSALVVLAAGAALLGRTLVDGLFLRAVDLDVCHGFSSCGRFADILQCCPWKIRRAGPAPHRPVGAIPPPASSCCAPSRRRAPRCPSPRSPARPGCTRTRCAATSTGSARTATSPGSASAPPAAVAGVLAGTIARTSPDPQAEARRAGSSWGRDVAADLPAAHGPDAARAAVLAVMEGQGFAPDAPEEPAAPDAPDAPAADGEITL